MQASGAPRRSVADHSRLKLGNRQGVWHNQEVQGAAATPRYVIGAHAPRLVWVRAGHRSLVRLRSKLSRKSESITTANSGRAPCRKEDCHEGDPTGRKTDLSDGQWLQRLPGAGRLRGSLGPGDAITRLRALQRQMGNLARERTRCVQWIQQALDQMNVQVQRAVSDLTGQTGMAIVRAIVAGERDARQLAALRGKRCRKSEEEFARYLTGNWREEQLFNLGQALELYDTLQKQIAVYEQRREDEIRALTPQERKQMPPPKHPNAAKEKAIGARGERAWRDDLFRFAEVDLTPIDGISVGTARTILTEVGLDLSAFPGEKHFVSWLRLAPRTAVSGGKPLPRNKSGGRGSNRVAAVLRMAAVALQRSHSALGAHFRRIARRKGYRVAVFATARKLARLVYRMLRWGQDYVDIGAQAYELRFRQLRIAGMQRAADALGYELLPQAQLSS